MQIRKLEKFDIDLRWVGPHGIGRFAEEINERMSFANKLRWGIAPAHPLDVFILTIWHLFKKNRFIYSPGYNAPFFGLDRFVLTVHDLNHIDLDSSWLKRLYYYLVLRRACRKCRKVLTVSEYSKQRVVEWAGVPDSHVVNVGNGVGSAFSVEGPVHLPGFQYFFCVSNRKLHKNEERMLRAFSQTKMDSAVKLLITGENSPELSGLIDELGLSSRVEFVGELSDSDLASHYRGALGLVFVSLYEGFGLPIIEAMSCGTPVITSNVTGMCEVAGPAAMLVDPLSETEISSAISTLEADEQGLRAHLKSLGLERARAFNWELVAQRVFEALVQCTAPGD